MLDECTCCRLKNDILHLFLGNSVNGIVGDKYDVDESAVGKWDS